MAAKVVMDRVSDRSKGFGFVTFASEEEAEKALTELNGKVRIIEDPPLTPKMLCILSYLINLMSLTPFADN